MLNVFLTIDVEIWCDGWTDLDRKFPNAFERYVYGRTSAGEFGLRYQADMLQSHGLKGVFFVEPLFSGRFGTEPLAEIVGLVRERGHEIQLHLHTEWLDEWPVPLFRAQRQKRQYVRNFSADEQRVLIAEGMRRLEAAGAERINCFRAGSFGFNAATLDALAASNVPNDASYNATCFGTDSGVAPGLLLNDIHRERGVTEFPMTVYATIGGRLRHVQLSASSWREIEHLLWAALEAGHQAFVILSHNFELLTPSKTRHDPVVDSRFRQLCQFLDRHRDSFTVRGFHVPTCWGISVPKPPLRMPILSTLRRVGEQVYRRRYL
jgi:hypothetical protein